MCWLLVSLLSCVLWFSSEAVDRSNFKKCSESSFCARNRAIQPGSSAHYVDPATVNVASDKATFSIHNSNLNAVLQLVIRVEYNMTITEVIHFVQATVSFLDQTVRIHINDQNPRRPRHEVQGVLPDRLNLVPFKTKALSSDSLTITWQENTLVVTFNPFRIDLLRGDALVASVNSLGLLNFEVHRDRQDSDDASMWAETFKSHADSKPYGPSSVGLDIVFSNSENLYGIPEHASTLRLKETTDEPYRLYNLDVFEYELDNPMALYGSIPFMTSHSPRQSAGAFFLNSAEMWVDVSYKSTTQQGLAGMLRKLLAVFENDPVEGEKSVPMAETHWMAESGVIDLFLFMGPKPKHVFQQYAALTGLPRSASQFPNHFFPGKTELPPLFALAYHQCRWNYNDEADVAGVIEKLDEHDIPVDVIWLDIEHTDGKRYFTWDAAKFPNSIQMIENVASKGRKMVNIVDPHIKRASDYYIHTQATELGIYIKNKDGGDYEGWCWPGSSSWLDFMNPSIQSWWSDQFALDKYQGTTKDLYIWNDMNEPSVFNGPEITMHKDAKHFGGWEHRDVHNIYGMWQQAATAEGIRRRSGGVERPFVLSRAFFSGSQKYGAIWTGDNKAEWGHLKASVPMILSINVAGLPFAGADMGGFFGNPDTELVIRWYQAGSFQPFMRAHAHLDTKRREPYLFEKEDMLLMRDAIRARYTFLPYWYTVFQESSTTGNPVVRPLWVEYPNESEIFSEEETYLIGSDLLVAPALSAGVNSVSVYFPGTEPWYDIETYFSRTGPGRKSVAAPLRKTPVFQRGGSIVPRKMRVRRSSTLMKNDPFTLYVALDSKGFAEGFLYADDYHTYSYKSGAFVLRRFACMQTGEKLMIQSFAAGSGVYATAEWIERIVVLGVNGAPSSVTSGNVSLGFTFKEGALTIKKPAANVADDFIIEIRL